MVEYDPQIIYKFTTRLYRQADSALALSTIFSFILGGAMGLALGITLLERMLSSFMIAFVGAVVMSALGFLVGQERAFRLKLQAQIALCQVKIEENTRKAV